MLWLENGRRLKGMEDIQEEAMLEDNCVDASAASGHELLSLLRATPAYAAEETVLHGKWMHEDSSDRNDSASVSTELADSMSWWGDSSGDFDPPPLEGDETLPGPDGELYEIFYPPDCMPEHLPEMESTYFENGVRSSSSPCGQKEWGQEPEPALLSTGPSLWAGRQTPAEVFVADIVSFMAHSAVKSYPARVDLFQKVQEAAVRALGNHFQRFVLIGSTALRIDTPDSDLDAVVFSQSVWEESEVPAPHSIHVLHSIAGSLTSFNEGFEIQLVDCTKVPVLTVFAAERSLSLDLTVNEGIGEVHVQWFQRQQGGLPAPLHSVPIPSPDGWSQGLEVAALRCVKWWLRRRRIPVPKEGGYPSIAWTLMVLHVLRCSVFFNGAEDTFARGQTLLRAMAAFFDRFAESGLDGTFLFTACAGAQFRPPLAVCEDEEEAYRTLPTSALSVLDPTTTDEDSIANGIQAAELAPQTSSATQLLYAYEFRRAQAFSAVALMSGSEGEPGLPSDGGDALYELFQDVDDTMNTMPTSLPKARSGVLVLRGNFLQMGILQKICPKQGWQASFLHRRDVRSSFALRLCGVDADTGAVTQFSSSDLAWFHPCDFVCLAALQDDEDGQARLDQESLSRWREMRAILCVDPAEESLWCCPDAESCNPEDASYWYSCEAELSSTRRRSRGGKRRQSSKQTWNNQSHDEPRNGRWRVERV
jgi:hypothetical protein